MSWRRWHQEHEHQLRGLSHQPFSPSASASISGQPMDSRPELEWWMKWAGVQLSCQFLEQIEFTLCFFTVALRNRMWKMRVFPNSTGSLRFAGSGFPPNVRARFSRRFPQSRPTLLGIFFVFLISGKANLSPSYHHISNYFVVRGARYFCFFFPWFSCFFHDSRHWQSPLLLRGKDPRGRFSGTSEVCARGGRLGQQLPAAAAKVNWEWWKW